MNLAANNIILGLFITLISYMFFPFFKFYRKYNYSEKEIKKFNLINSIIVFLTLFVIVFLLYGESENIVPAFFYYFINNYIWLKNASKIKINEQIKEPSGLEEFIGVSLVILNILLLLTSSTPIIPDIEINNFYQLYSCITYIIGEFIFYIIGMFLIAHYKKKEKQYKKYISESKK